MNVTMVFRDVSAGERLRAHVGGLVVRCQLHSRSGFYRAEGRGARARAVDAAIEKFSKQRRRRKVQAVRARRLGP